MTCPYCEAPSGYPNGHRDSVGKGRLQKVRCGGCGRHWTLEAPDEVGPFRGKRIHVPVRELLKAIALVVIGIPVCQIETEVGIKAETVKLWLERLLREGRWDELACALEARFSVPRADLKAFEVEIVLGRDFDRSAFRSWARRLRQKNRADQVRTQGVVARILGHEARTMR